MLVLKFGGSSVAKPDRIKQVGRIIKNYNEDGKKLTVVFSALGGVTDELIAISDLAAKGNSEYLLAFQKIKDRHFDCISQLLGEEKETADSELAKRFLELGNVFQGVFLVRELTRRSLDYILSFGERNSAYIITQYFQSLGIPSEYLDARKLITTDKKFGAATVDKETTYKKIKEYYSGRSSIQVVTGFIASAKGGLTTTLGRGGSDYTAALLAGGLQAEAIEIWTDVDGVLTADPRKVKSAFKIKNMTYAEAMEMSHFGAKVIYPPTLQPAFKENIPLYIKNTFNPSEKGTYISGRSFADERSVKGISSISNIALLTLQGSGLFGEPGIAARLFNAISAVNVNVILITQGSSELSISFAVSPTDAKKAANAANKEFKYEIQEGLVSAISVEKELAVIGIIGENMRFQSGISGRLFKALGQNGINVRAIAQGSSELNISVVVSSSNEVKALNAIHEGFFLSDTKVVHLFIVGVGLIGGTLINQIKKQSDYLRKEKLIELRVIGISNSRKMHFDEDGIDISNWKATLKDSSIKADMPSFIDKMNGLNLRNSIFIDNTASPVISKFYEQILDLSISISTPNKIATSSSFIRYKRLKEIANKRNVYFYYETNVGAGLPIISTMENLIASGDEIQKIEGVLSGSLSFIFNKFKKGLSFYDIVKEAQAKGFTEPDPRIDLGGVDVRRKLVILSRETGIEMEPEDVQIKNFLPQSCIDAKSVEAFFEELKNEENYFSDLISAAADKNEVLRMVAILDGKKASIELVSVGVDHPFYGLNGSDNMIVFTTQRYHERPLIIRGPGAGAEVTAAGVFAEIIQISSNVN